MPDPAGSRANPVTNARMLRAVTRAMFIDCVTGTGDKSPSVSGGPVLRAHTFFQQELPCTWCRWVFAMGVNSKGSGEARLVWRVTAENPNGELLELVPKEAPRGSRSRQVKWTRVPPAPPDGPLGVRRLEPRAAPEPVPRPESSAAKAEYSTSWRGSSWDLLNGAIVRDVSDKIPPRTFDALFSANEPSNEPSNEPTSDPSDEP
jgi:hypothetical protein